MILVLDASAAIEVVLNRDRAARLRELIHEADYVVAPDLYICEVSNALWKYDQMLTETIDPAVLDDAVGIPDDYLAARSLYREAYALGLRFGHPIYDCMYVVAARRNNATLATMDKRLQKLAKREQIAVFVP